MSDTLGKAIGWSVLLHLVVIAVLWYTQQPLPVTERTQPRAIEAFIYQPLPPPAKPLPVELPDKVPAPEKIAPAPVAQPVVASPQQTAPQPASKLPTKPEVTAEQQQAEPPTAPSDDSSQTTDVTYATKPIQDTGTAMSIAERSLAIANRRHADVSSEVLAASQQRPELRDRPATTAKAQLKPEHVADNVLMVLKDGSFLEKIGDYCYHANNGANLRADISSMKPVPCGKDKNVAMFERIMSKVGQDR